MKTLLLVTALTLAITRAEDLPAHVIVLARAQHRLRADMEAIPAFACMETISRLVRAKADAPWKASDVIRIEVAEIGDSELYSWPGADEFQKKNLGDMIGVGLTGGGDFSHMAKSAMVDGVSRIRFSANDGELARFDYEIPLFQSGFTIGHNGARGTAGQKGSFWIDRKTFDLVRLEWEAVDLPPGVLLAEARQSIEYARVRIGERKVLLPQRTDTLTAEFNGSARRNITEFSHCREYSVESKLILNPEEKSAGPTVAAAKRVVLPASIQLTVVLETELAETMAVGEPVVGRVQRSSDPLIPPGARVLGRIRRMDFVESPKPGWFVALEFSRMDWPGSTAAFFGQMDSLPNHNTIRDSLVVTKAVSKSVSTQETVTLPPIPGVRTFLVEGKTFRIPEGLEMKWRTVDPKQ